MSKLPTRKAVLVKGALMAYLAPLLAQDAKLDLTPVLDGVTGKNFGERKPGIVTALRDAVKGKLAQDAEIEDVTKLLDALGEVSEPEAVDTAPLATAPNGAVPWAEFKEKLKDRLNADEMTALDSYCGGKAMDEESEEDKKKREDEEARTKAAKDEEAKNMVTKPAMDAAITEAVAKAKKETRDEQRAIQDATRAVRPYVGELAMAHDSAESVYRTALSTLGRKIAGVESLPLAALKAILENQPLPSTQRNASALAMDAASTDSFSKRFPDAARIPVAG